MFPVVNEQTGRETLINEADQRMKKKKRSDRLARQQRKMLAKEKVAEQELSRQGRQSKEQGKQRRKASETNYPDRFRETCERQDSRANTRQLQYPTI
jgi:hypothetical protein